MSASPSEPSAAPQRCAWVLLGSGAGGNSQLCTVAEALGWPYERKRLVYNPLQALPNPLLGASAASLDRRRSDRLQAPWPDLVLAASRRSAPIARWIRRRSGGRTRLVHLLHAQAPLEAFDLLVTLPQYRLPQRPNVLQLGGALNRVSPGELERAGRQWSRHFEALPRPWLAVLVGGSSSSYRLGPEIARRLARLASGEARRAGGSLLISTTPRTSPAAAEALLAAVDVPRFVYRWRRDDPHNPYRALLALADRFIVTADSASLPVEASATGRPVQVFEWPRRGSRRLRPLVGWRARLASSGWSKPARDFGAYHRALRQRGLVTRLGDEPLRAPARAPDELGLVVDRIHALFDAERA